MSTRLAKKNKGTKTTTLTVEELGAVDVKKAAAWIKAISFEDWPQQSRIDEQPRPSMVSNPEWHGFGSIAHDIIYSLGFDDAHAFQPMLSVVMPGHSIEPHQDAQADYWQYRVHVPLLTNAKAYTEMEDGQYHMQVGKAYKVNTTAKHAIWNKGSTPRVHFMFDVK